MEQETSIIDKNLDNNEVIEKNQIIENNKNLPNTVKKSFEQEHIETLNKKQNIFIMSLIFLSAFISFSIYWIYSSTGNVTLDQLLFHLMVPIKGTNMGMIWDYIVWTFSRILLVLGITALLIYVFESKTKISCKIKKRVLYIISKITLVASIVGVLIAVNMFGFIKNQVRASSYIQNEYVDPSTVDVQFPDEKQNLIYIYLESMENTYASIQDGGMYVQSRIPELTQIAKENINFSNNDKIGGALELKGTHWTIAAMVSQTAGIPLKISVGENDYGKHKTFLPGAYSLGEILEKNGYTNYLLLGSDSDFGGRKLYFESHGNYKIWDYNSAVAEKRMTEEEKVWWGYSDADLFKYAKEQLTEISEKEEPFNYTILTVDTHFTDGYICNDCNNYFEDQYSNVIKCSSEKVAEFVGWIKEQPFFENTTIIISGDHITMQSEIEEQAQKNGYKERTIYNAIINSRVETPNTKNRKFFSMDMYPTTLAALGAKIQGQRLGLGTNLFSDVPTIAERYDIQFLREELQKKSVFYNKELIYKKK